MRFADKACLVTGGASGIGLATCQQLAKEGAKVAVVDRNLDGAKAAAQSIGKNAVPIRCDVGVPGDIEGAVAETVRQFGKIDILVNDAAMMTFNPVVDLTLDQWDHVLSVNLRSVFLFCKECIPHMKNGSIVNVSSVHAHETTANVVPYASSKGGMEAFTRAVSREYKVDELRINCVAPGAIDTPMLWNNPNIKDGAEKLTGPIGKPEDIAAAICFLASDEAKFVHGTTLVVDGGRLDTL
jgi:NAD(P)-dependent dehydrogenase (short-subunit alcohol dehydrogenase family)